MKNNKFDKKLIKEQISNTITSKFIKTLKESMDEQSQKQLQNKDINSEFKDTIRSYFFGKVDNSDEFKKVFPEKTGDKSGLPEEIMGNTNNQFSKSINSKSFKDFIGDGKQTKFIDSIIPFGKFMKDVNQSSTKQQKNVKELKLSDQYEQEKYRK